jgi:microcystin-dependent protein
MTIIGSFPTTLANGQPEDATQVMSLFSWIQSQVNGNACAATITTNVLKGDGSGDTTSAVSGTDYLAPNADYIVGAGSANAYTTTFIPAITTLTDGIKYRFKANISNTGASTLNANSLGVKPIVNWYGNPLVGGEIVASANIEVTYNTSFNSGNGAWVIENTIALPPVGSTMRWKTSTAPAGWLVCGGQAVSRTVYSALFSLLGTTYGAGDGSSTFNLPNSTDRMNIGAGNLYNLGSTGGSKDAIVVSHTHTATSVVTDPGHTHTNNAITYGSGGPAASSGGSNLPTTATINTATTGITVATTNAPSGTSGSGANLPPYFADYEIIKA